MTQASSEPAPRAGAPVWGRVAVAVALLGAPAACRRQPAARAAQPQLAPRAAPVPQPDPSRLPEDPVAGKRSEQQWREHMAREERERQLGFDRKRLDAHRAVVRLLRAARARYDRASSKAAVERVRRRMPRRVSEIRRRVKAIDPWGVNSRLLLDYEALAQSLTGAYADARERAIGGDTRALQAARVDFDRHLQAIADWLAEAAEGEHE